MSVGVKNTYSTVIRGRDKKEYFNFFSYPFLIPYLPNFHGRILLVNLKAETIKTKKKGTRRHKVAFVPWRANSYEQQK